MPELPEVETARRQLERWLGGRELVAVHLLDPAAVRRGWSTSPSDADPEAALAVGALRGTVGPGRRHGKRLALGVADRSLLIHLGMTGKWLAQGPSEPPPRFARFGLKVEGLTAWFCDSRRFGCLRLVAAPEVGPELRAGHGPDALDEPLDGPSLGARLQTRRPIKVALLEQDRLAGLGNIHAAEALFKARIHPSVPARDLLPSQLEVLAQAIADQLREALVGVDDLDQMVYVNEGGENPFAVYGREGLPCLRCATPLVEDKLGGRTTTHCPLCQPPKGLT